MEPIALFNQWLDTLAGLAEKLGSAARQRRAITAREADGAFSIHTGSKPESQSLMFSAGSSAPEEIMRLTRGKFISLECPATGIIIRHIGVPAKARDFLAGVVRNQIDRLSPWPSAQIVYGYHARKPETAEQAMLDIEVFIARRNEIDELRARFASTGLSADQIVVAAAEGTSVSLWLHQPQQQSTKRSMRLIIGGSLGAILLLCAGTSLWALMSSSSLQAESEENATRIRALQKNAGAKLSPQMLASLPQPRRAWIAKETSVSALIFLEAMSRAVPDGAYLDELRLEGGKVHLTGLADDAPPLIGALERSGHLAEVHFSAPTTRGPDGKLSRFSVEARVVPSLELKIKGD